MIRFRIAMRHSRGRCLAAAAQTPEYGYQVIHAYPHDPNAFTEGLEYRAGFLYESTGLKGRSSLRKVKLETGQVLQQIDIDPQYFGEGITVLNQQIVATHLAVRRSDSCTTNPAFAVCEPSIIRAKAGGSPMMARIST